MILRALKAAAVITAILIAASCQNVLISGLDEFYINEVNPADLRPKELNSENKATGDLTLVSALSGGRTVEWITGDHPSVMDDGSLNRPDYPAPDSSAGIKAKVTFRSGASTEIEFTVIVPRTPVDDATAVAEAVDSLAIGFRPGDSSTSISGDLLFPATGLHSTVVGWNAGAHSQLSSDGTVSLIHSNWWEAAQTVTAAVTATISRGSSSAAKNFTLSVATTPAAAPTPVFVTSTYINGSTPAQDIRNFSIERPFGADSSSNYEFGFRTSSSGVWSGWSSFTPSSFDFTDASETGFRWNLSDLDNVNGIHQFRIRIVRNGIIGPWYVSNSFTDY